MGNCCEPSQIERNATEIRRYKKSIETSLNAYKFVEANPDSFVQKIVKENGVTSDIAKIWLEIYIDYMVWLGFNYDTTPKKKIKKLMDEDMNRFLALPYEILQVWRVHVLYTNKYQEFCDIVTNKGNNCIPFTAPKPLWKSLDPTILNKNFRFNHDLLVKINPKRKADIDTLFVFQSSYLKNTLHYNLCESIGGNIVRNIVGAYEREVNNSNGIFKMETRDLNSLKSLSANIENMIFSSVVPNQPAEAMYQWPLTENVYGAVREKSTMFQNIQFPSNFEISFGIDHLLSLKQVYHYVDEYKKFLFVSYATNDIHCPSEQVDLVWHYHMLFTKEYRLFSKLHMGKDVFAHNPSDGTVNDYENYKKVYEKTVNFLFSAFGSINQEVWPRVEVRFSQMYRWYNHHHFISQTSYWTQGKRYTNTKVTNTRMYVGCYIGCGFHRGVYLGCGN